MEETSGLTVADAQYSICKGNYGGKAWSVSEQQAACHRYKEMTGISVQSGARDLQMFNLTALTAVFALLIVTGIVVVILRRRKFGRQAPKKASHR